MDFEVLLMVAWFNVGLIQMGSIYLWAAAERINSFLVSRDKLGVDKIIKAIVLLIWICNRVSIIIAVSLI